MSEPEYVDHDTEGCAPHVAERVYCRGEAWVVCACGATITCGRGAEFGFEGHAHTDDCLPLLCPVDVRNPPDMPSVDESEARA